jgi:hypothetical protein|tara:strand:+ start:815 stop:922 length:108 start_codon:yes stop_codon:yes gene_type:complete
MNELVAGLCVACLVGGWVVYMIGKKKQVTFKDLKK